MGSSKYQNISRVKTFSIVALLFLIPSTASAAVVFDAINSPTNGTETTDFARTFATNWGLTGDPGHDLIELNFDYTTTSQVEITQLNALWKTAQATTTPMQIFWRNGNGDIGISEISYVSGTAVTTTWNFGAGQHPFAYPYGTPISFEFQDASDLPNTGSDKTNNLDRTTSTGFGEITSQSAFVVRNGAPSNFTYQTWNVSTYGVPRIQLVGGASPVFPGLIAPSLPPTSTSITASCPDFGFFTPLCDAVVWFFVPDVSGLADSFGQVKQSASAKFPFSYITSLNDAWTSSTAATTGTTVLLTVNTSAWIPTSTAFGTSTIGTIEFFSASTVRTYVPDGAWTTMRTLMELAVYFGTAEMIYFGALHLLKKET